jgi:hypothetical protein
VYECVYVCVCLCVMHEGMCVCSVMRVPDSIGVRVARS